MPIRVAVPKEITPGERRVAMAPDVVSRLVKLGFAILLEKGAGLGSHMTDEDFGDVTVVDAAADLYAQADLVFKINPPTPREVALMQEGIMVLGAMLPSKHPQSVTALRDRKITCWATELIPRISRAQSMDTLSSQAAVAGYKGVLMAAGLSSKFYPMLTTAAGTIRPAKVLVIGAGVAGLQAIATAKRLGAMVEAYDIRPETKEQCESLGAKFVDTGIHAAGEGGYARALTAEEQAKQKEILDRHITKADGVIATAALPGRPSPKIIDAAAVASMKPGAVIVDLASEGGGNCALTRSGETIEHHGVIVHGPLNVAGDLAVHASEMFARNLLNFVTPMVRDGRFQIDWDDEIIAKSCLTHDGEIRHGPTKNRLEEDA